MNGRHLSLLAHTAPSLAQPDIPPTFDINHDSSIIDPLSAMEEKNVRLYRFQPLLDSPSHVSAPHTDAQSLSDSTDLEFVGCQVKLVFTRLNLDALH